jgi:L-alanine-DL-glutamate epimerase-like enolase superfamily enzyme
VDVCVVLRQFIAERGWKTLLADGEGQHDLKAYLPLAGIRAIDVPLGDMNSYGIEGILTEASMAEPRGILVAQHNWGSPLGFYLQLHVGVAVPDFYRAENDPLTSDVLIAEGYEITDGACSVPDAPGFGLAIDESKFRHTTVNFDLRA